MDSHRQGLPSLSAEGCASGNAERRAAQRFTTVLRVGRVIADQDEGLARIRNISDEGAQLRMHLAARPGDRLRLELTDGVIVPGQVVWTSGNDCGLKFDDSIDSATMLAGLATGAAQGIGRPVRLAVKTSAITDGEHGIRLARVTDISQRGMKLRHDGSIAAGALVKITLPSGLSRLGVVRWSRNDAAGVMLLDPFTTEELGSARRL